MVEIGLGGKIFFLVAFWFVFVGNIMDYSEGWGILTALIPAVFVLLLSIANKPWDRYRDDDDGNDGGGY